MLKTTKARYTIDYSISLDTQALSYIQRYIETGSRYVTSDFSEAFKIIADPYVNIDPSPYLMENLFNNKTSHDQLFSNFKYYEILRNIDYDHYKKTGVVKSNLSSNEIISATQGTLSNIFYKHSQIKIQHTVSSVYCLLLKLSIIQLKNPKQGIKKKIISFIDFCHNELSTHFTGIYLVAIEYFKRGNDLKFFSAIQLSNKPESLTEKYRKLSDKLKNMSWDLWHAYNLQSLPTILNYRADYFIGGILTFDKGLGEILEILSLHCLVYSNGNMPLPFYSNEKMINFENIIGSEYIQSKYFSENATEERNKNRAQSIKNQSQTIETIEQELIDILKAHIITNDIKAH